MTATLFAVFTVYYFKLTEEKAHQVCLKLEKRCGKTAGKVKI